MAWQSVLGGSPVTPYTSVPPLLGCAIAGAHTKPASKLASTNLARKRMGGLACVPRPTDYLVGAIEAEGPAMVKRLSSWQ
jgi:hypothetical protein